MIRVTDKQYWMHPNLKKNLDTIIYNINDDYDFVIIITGDGMTRVGKSMLAQQIAYYVAWRLGKPFTHNNVVFGGGELQDLAKTLPKRSVIVNDESRADLSSKKAMETHSKELMDFFNECGKYNHLMILVATDFFDFNKGIALNRSELLINVKRLSKERQDNDGNYVMQFIRGYADIYGRKRKKKLYQLGKRNFDDYSVVPRDTYLEFRKAWVVDEEEYNKKKDLFLERERGMRKTKGYGELIYKLKKHPKTANLTDEDIAEILKVSRMTIHRHKKKVVTELVMPH